MTRDPWREEIEREFVVEKSGWAAERAQRVTEALQRTIVAGPRFDTLVVWMDQYQAFTMPGRTIYISRRLFELMPTDDAVAMIVAHELAHHRLGHIPEIALPALTLHWARQLFHMLYARQEREHQADLLGMELCVEAGYDPAACVRAFELLQQVALDYRDIDGAIGAEDGSVRPHPALDQRIAAVLAHAEAMRSGHRIDVERAATAARRKRRALAIAGGAVGAVALTLLLRRPR